MVHAPKIVKQPDLEPPDDPAREPGVYFRVPAENGWAGDLENLILFSRHDSSLEMALSQNEIHFLIGEGFWKSLIPCIGFHFVCESEAECFEVRDTTVVGFERSCPGSQATWRR